MYLCGNKVLEPYHVVYKEQIVMTSKQLADYASGSRQELSSRNVTSSRRDSDGP